MVPRELPSTAALVLAQVSFNYALFVQVALDIDFGLKVLGTGLPSRFLVEAQERL